VAKKWEIQFVFFFTGGHRLNCLKFFRRVERVKRRQAAHMDKMIAQCDMEDIVLQVDFSENVTIASQHEIQ